MFMKCYLLAVCWQMNSSTIVNTVCATIPEIIKPLMSI